MGAVLGDFIRTRRDATSVEAVGLRAGPRRRVPGLRRSELADLAGISVEYLVRLEQGRDRNPSPAVVGALAGALRLNPAQRDYLRHLAKLGSGCNAAHLRPREDVRGPVLAMLDMLEPGVAYVTNRLGDILAMTSGFAALAPDLVRASRPNLTRFVFLDPRAREVFPDWDLIADAVVSDLWLGPAEARRNLFSDEQIAEAGPELARRLENPALPSDSGWSWKLPEVGELRFDREVMELSACDSQQVVVLVAADAATSTKLDRLRSVAAA